MISFFRRKGRVNPSHHVTTTTSLLRGLFDSRNDVVWREFHGRYYPIMLSVGSRLGLSPEDAADAAQETLTRFVVEYRNGRYDRSRGPLRAWIIGIAKYRIADLNRAKAKQRCNRGLSAIEQLPGDNELDDIWEQECTREILRRAMSRLKNETRLDPQTVRIFEEITLKQKSVGELAEQFHVEPTTIYKAKQRCLDQLKTFIRELNQVYEIA